MKNVDSLISTKISRRTLLAGVGVAGSATLLTVKAAHATVKVPKSAARFSSVASNGHACGGCKNFLPPSACIFVEGKTAPDCSCWIWRGETA